MGIVMLSGRRPWAPFTLSLFACSLLFSSSGCQVQTNRATAQRPPAQPMFGARPVSATNDAYVTEAFRAQRLQGQGMLPLFLPGAHQQQLVRYQVVDGLAMMEGDILLGPVEQLAFRYGFPWARASNVKSAVARTGRSHLWPSSEIPYVIDASISAKMRDHIAWAISHMNTTELKLRPKSNTDTDHVVFVDKPRGGCSSYVGRIGGPQEIQLEEACGRGSVVHEILHAAGFYHEQSRGDRDDFITIHWDEITEANKHNFDKRDSLGQDIGDYDYASIMHYSSQAFSRRGKATITPKQPVKIGQRDGLSERDRAAIAYLYGNGTAPEPRTQPPPPQPPPPQPPPPQPPPPSPTEWNGSFAGEYSSARGNVSCTQNGTTVNCQYPGGAMFCTANGSRLDCAWTGMGGGRAAFERQSTGVLAGTYGDFLSSNSRGPWDLNPLGAGPTPPQPPPPQPPPPQPPPPQPQPQPSGQASLSGNYASTRGPMACNESATSLQCGFTEQGARGQLDCQKDATASNLDCTWMTFFPRPGAGRATLRRASPTERVFSGTWGYFAAENGGGVWEMKGQ